MDPSPFTPQDIGAIKAILADPTTINPNDPYPARHHVEHCLWQMVRFAQRAAVGSEKFRSAQWGLNFGRAQELLKSYGGPGAWWREFEPLLISEDWLGLDAKARRYLRLFGLPQPTGAFFDRS